MPIINLIAQERQRKRQLAKRVRLLSSFWIALALLTLLGYGAVMLYVAALGASERAVEAELTRLESTLKQVEATRQGILALQPQLTTLKSAQVDTTRWQRVLTHLSTQTPRSTWLTTIRTNDRTNAKSPLTISLAGIAASQQLVGEWMLRLNQCADLDKVELRYTQERMISPLITAVDFEVGAELKGTAAPQTKEENQNGSTQKS